MQKRGDYLEKILRSNKTIFSLSDILILWREANSHAAIIRLSYFVKKGSLIKIRRGLYAKDNNYEKLELATSVLVPSYISFETVLSKEGLIFQYYKPIFVASYTNRNLNINGQDYQYRYLKKEILVNSIGIKNDDLVAIAGKERAFLDTLFVKGEYYFDNIRSINWEKVYEILPIYKSKKLEKVVNNLKKQYDT